MSAKAKGPLNIKVLSLLRKKVQSSVIVTGRAFLRTDAEHIPFGTGDLVLLPHGEEHQLADPAEGAAIPLAALPSERSGHNAAFLCYSGDRAAAYCESSAKVSRVITQ